ncbi:hypothetical protein NUACC21_75150 [Scytonema sp. NUACC21]
MQNLLSLDWVDKTNPTQSVSRLAGIKAVILRNIRIALTVTNDKNELKGLTLFVPTSLKC